uniref:Putative dna repair protein RAD50 n=1 Tax=Schistosoma mansoni TaxID=6183 RepID=A0A3Q0KL19_SCHMA
MALIERMSILGIRSFGQETSQKIEFFTPVTLILGQNGTGKTTVIECLKYSATGELPPGSKTGCSFIHDPRITQESEVKAKVTLQIRDVKGCPMVVSRALMATQRDKTKQGTLKTLDGSIKRQYPDGRVTSVSLRCTDLDQEMVTSLGVSKAVLENVIFCHQEDSNWPLQEAKSVKQRFDDLFASSRYVKALDAIRKCKQDNDGNVKLYKTELKHLTKNRDEALKLRSEREETLHSIEKQEKNLEEMSAKLQPVVEKLNRYKERYAELTKLQAEIKSCEAERAHLTDTIKNLMLNIQNEYQGSDEELKRLIEDAETEYEKKIFLLNKSENILQNKRKELSTLETNQTKTIVEKTQIEMEVKRLNEAIINRDMILASIVTNYIPGNKYADVKQFTDADVEYIMQFVDGLLHESENQLTEVKLLSANEERKAQTDVDLVRDELAALKQKIQTIKRNYNQQSCEKVNIEKRLENEHSLNERIEKVKDEFHKSEITVKDLNMDHELNNLHQSITESLGKKKELEHSISLIDEKIATFQKSANKYRELELVQKERANKLEGIRKIRSRHAEALEQIFSGSVIPFVATEKSLEEQANPNNIRSFINDQTRLRIVFSKRLNELEQSTRETRKQLAKIEQERSSLEATSKFNRNHLQEKRDQLKILEGKLLSVPGADDLEQTLINLQERRGSLEEEYANEQGSVFLWRKFRDRLSRIDSDCPVCHRCFDSDAERDELLNEIDNRIKTLPSEFERKKQELKDIVSRLESLVELRPISLEIKNLHEEIIPALELKIKAELDKLTDVRSQRDKTSALLETYQADESLAKTVQGDLAILERLENESYELTVKINQFKYEFTDITTTDSQLIDVLQEERKSLRETLLTLSQTIDQKQKRVDQLNQAQREAVSEMHRLKDQLHKLQQENLDNVQLKNDLSRLTRDCETLKKELSELESEQLPVVHRRWTKACSERSRIAKICEQNIEQATTKVNEIGEKLKKLNDACTSVEFALNSQPLERLKTILETAEGLQKNLSLVKSEADTCSENIELLKKQVNEHKMRQRELADCVQVRQLRCQLNFLTERTESLAKNQMICDNIPLSDQDLINETKRLALEEEKLHSLKQDISNQLSELNAKLCYLNRDLNEKYTNADNEYRDMMYQLKTSELACSDLERYYKALDRAIMSYHAVKMADLNKIIRELWRSTYRGNDIDYIEICSEEDTAAASNVCRTRRTYNYRVVMVKTTPGSMSVSRPKSKSYTSCSNEARLDMRGRCSAGQKVLASLIIRLALAEVFCLHCGVLALDEPTTNLDRENIESLAYALVEIIKSRSRQKNFQLIVITHDEDFVELLGRSDYVENFFLLSRDAQGLSEIRKVPIGEHFH